MRALSPDQALAPMQVVGVLKMRTFLSGMPECKLGLNDKVLFESQGRSNKQKVRRSL